jgi:hypothetical protein
LQRVTTRTLEVQLLGNFSDTWKLDFYYYKKPRADKREKRKETKETRVKRKTKDKRDKRETREKRETRAKRAKRETSFRAT